LFVRPEYLRITPAGEPGTIAGKVVAQTYHGGHVDLQIDCRDRGQNGQTRVLIRSAGDRALSCWPPGTEVGISIDTEGCAAFPAVP
jgi:hypothetical protein